MKIVPVQENPAIVDTPRDAFWQTTLILVSTVVAMSRKSLAIVYGLYVHSFIIYCIKIADKTLLSVVSTVYIGYNAMCCQVTVSYCTKHWN